jgi:hypothetical protein
MKRKVLLFLVFCSIAKSQCFLFVNSSIRDRTHWSPYTQSLVGGNLEYSPYALSYRSSGLIDRDLEYSPYAFSYKNSGLVSKYGYTSNSFLNIITDNQLSVCLEPSYKDDYKEKVETQKKRLAEIKEIKKNSGSNIIKDYLKSKNIIFIEYQRLSFNNKIVSVSFILKDKLIKYWDPEAVVSLCEKREFIYNKYCEEWKEFQELYEKEIGQVFTITSVKSEDIIKKLENIL